MAFASIFKLPSGKTGNCVSTTKKRKLKFIEPISRKKNGSLRVKDKTEVEHASLRKSFSRIFNVKNEAYGYVREFFTDDRFIRDGRPDLYNFLRLRRDLYVNSNNNDFFFVRKSTSEFIKTIKKNKLLSQNVNDKSKSTTLQSMLSVIIRFTSRNLIENDNDFLKKKNDQNIIDTTGRIILLPHGSKTNTQNIFYPFYLPDTRHKYKDYVEYCKLLIVAIVTFIRKYDSLNFLNGYGILIVVQFIDVPDDFLELILNNEFTVYCKNYDLRIDIRQSL